MLFGAGNACQTTPYNDGGFLARLAAAYYSGRVAAPSAAAATMPSGTPEATPTPTPTWRPRRCRRRSRRAAPASGRELALGALPPGHRRRAEAAGDQHGTAARSRHQRAPALMGGIVEDNELTPHSARSQRHRLHVGRTRRTATARQRRPMVRDPGCVWAGSGRPDWCAGQAPVELRRCRGGRDELSRVKRRCVPVADRWLGSPCLQRTARSPRTGRAPRPVPRRAAACT